MPAQATTDAIDLKPHRCRSITAHTVTVAEQPQGDVAMGFRFRRSVKVLPGVRLNISSKGISTTVGVRGASVNFGTRGTTLNVGIPGTGISYSERISSGSDVSRAEVQHINE